MSEEDIQLNRTAAERANKACEKIEVISEAIEVLYAFASESEPSKVSRCATPPPFSSCLLVAHHLLLTGGYQSNRLLNRGAISHSSIP